MAPAAPWGGSRSRPRPGPVTEAEAKLPNARSRCLFRAVLSLSGNRVPGVQNFRLRTVAGTCVAPARAALRRVWSGYERRLGWFRHPHAAPPQGRQASRTGGWSAERLGGLHHTTRPTARPKSRNDDAAAVRDRVRVRLGHPRPHTRYQLPDIDINQVLATCYTTGTPLTFTRTMLWDMRGAQGRPPRRLRPLRGASGQRPSERCVASRCWLYWQPCRCLALAANALHAR
jgi:hypothetical protein